MDTNRQDTAIIWLLCTGIICYGVFYSANIYILQHITIASYGNFAVSLKILSMLCALLTIAKQFSLTIYMPQYEKSHKYIQRTSVTTWLFKNLSLSAFILTIGLATTWFLFYLINNETFVNVFQDSPFHFTLFFLPILAFFIILSCLSLAQKSLNKSVASFVTILPNILITAVFILGIFTINTKTMYTIGLFLTCQATVLVLYLFISQTQYAPNFASGYAIQEHNHWYTKSSIYWASTISHHFSIILSLLALEILSPEHYVGEYAIILLFVIAYFALISPLHTYLSSQLGVLLDTNHERLNKLIKIISKLQLVIILLGCIITIIFGTSLLAYIGAPLSILPLLITAMILFGLAIITSIPLRIVVHSELGHYALYLKGFRLIGCCLLLSALIPRYGVLGAIISDTVPLIIINITGALICSNRLKINGLALK